MPKNEPTLSYAAFLGVNNRERPSRLRRDQYGYGWLVAGENVDIDDTGGIEMRAGYGASMGLPGVTSAFATRDQSRLYVVQSGDLKRVVSLDPLVTEVLRSGISSKEVQWCEGGNMVFYTGAAQGMIDETNHYDMGIPTAAPPRLEAIQGTLPAGLYRVACTFSDANGREGGAGPAAYIELPDNAGIQMLLPVMADYDVLVWVSSVNGETLYALDKVTQGDTYAWYGDDPSTLALADEQMVSYPPPANAHLCEFHQSSLWMAEYHPQSDTTFVFYSKPFWFHLFDYTRDYLPIPGKVEMLASVPGGLVIGTGSNIKVYTDEGALINVADYGVIPGHNKAFTQGGQVVFWTERGVCSGLPFKNHTDQAYSVPPGTRAGVNIVEKDGRTMFVAAVLSGGVANNPY